MEVCGVVLVFRVSGSRCGAVCTTTRLGLCGLQELGTPNEKIWPDVSELPAMKKCTFTEYPYNQLRNRFGSTLTDTGFDLLNRYTNPIQIVT